MRVVRIPCLIDNQAYWLPDLGVIIDPSEAEPVLKALGGAIISAVWCTHHHPDHVGGIAGLKATFPDLQVYGSGKRPIAGLTCELADGDEVEGATVLSVPGHTLDALAFYLPDGDGDVFVGDTLFAMGCGRIFEGDATMMWTSLQRLRTLPATTRLWFGHDYAARNLQFSTAILPVDREPAPPPIALGRERSTNLFLRADDPQVAAAVGEAPGLATFSALRQRRDRF